MQLNQLSNLENTMRDNDINRYRFEYVHNGHRFDAIFLIDQNPFKLWMGAIGANFVLGFDVNPNDFSVDSYIDNYYDLCRFLNLQYQSGNHFSTNAFLRDFDNSIPRVIENFNPRNIPIPRDMIRYYRDVEEADKVYFYGWKDNNIRNENVSQKNLAKTLSLWGIEAHNFCRDYNYSTRWTDIPREEVEMVLPQIN